MTDSTADGKKRLRSLVAGVFTAFPRETFRRLDETLNSRLELFIATQRIETLFAFHPLADEPDVTPVLRAWLDQGGKLALPVWHGGGTMVFRLIADWERDLENGKGGLRQPRAACREAEFSKGDLVLTPGRAFSEDLARLGRGAGTYDSTLAGKELFRLGLCYDFQIFPFIPETKNDLRMNMVFTPGRKIQ